MSEPKKLLVLQYATAYIKHCISCLCVLGSFMHTNALLAQKGEADIFNAEHSKKYAQYLFNTGQYLWSAQEWERVYLLDAQEETLQQLLHSYRKAQRPDMAWNRYSLIDQKELFTLETNMEVAKALFQLNDYTRYTSFLEYVPSVSDTDKKILLQLPSIMGHGKLDPDFNNLNIEGSPYAQSLYPLLLTYQNENWKSPFTAGALSTVVPGLGKAYAGDWKNGLISLGFIAATAFQSYRGYNQAGLRSPSFWIFGGLCLGFYAGNLYGSTWTAKRYNQKIRNEYKKKLDRYFLDL